MPRQTLDDIGKKAPEIEKTRQTKKKKVKKEQKKKAENKASGMTTWFFFSIGTIVVGFILFDVFLDDPLIAWLGVCCGAVGMLSISLWFFAMLFYDVL